MTWRKTEPTSKLTQKTVKGVFWSYLSFVGGKGLGFLSTNLFARLLLPKQLDSMKFGTLVHVLVGEQMYQTGKRAVRLRVPTRGPR
jgi:hypothetical protein